MFDEQVQHYKEVIEPQEARYPAEWPPVRRQQATTIALPIECRWQSRSQQQQKIRPYCTRVPTTGQQE